MSITTIVITALVTLAGLLGILGVFYGLFRTKGALSTKETRRYLEADQQASQQRQKAEEVAQQQQGQRHQQTQARLSQLQRQSSQAEQKVEELAATGTDDQLETEAKRWLDRIEKSDPGSHTSMWWLPLFLLWPYGAGWAETPTVSRTPTAPVATSAVTVRAAPTTVVLQRKTYTRMMKAIIRCQKKDQRCRILLQDIQAKERIDCHRRVVQIQATCQAERAKKDALFRAMMKRRCPSCKLPWILFGVAAGVAVVVAGAWGITTYLQHQNRTH